ncbi:hypothetical protein [Tuberibacillus calidus]|uniref:hypothetical protein n=1 Tax=Tuberibacillus calidus TaxID=340097 RepID=UPI00040ABE85|nr:hypothetical protein [Tuberibacillus calidus]
MLGSIMLIITTFVIPMIPVFIFIVIFIFLVGLIRRMEKRSDERLKIEKENATLLQQQIQEINQRLKNIEKTLQEVD